MNILFLSIICSTILTSTSSYGMELPNKNISEKSTRIWSWPIATALTTIIVGTHQNTIKPVMKKAKDSSEDLDWEKIKADETAPTRTSSPTKDLNQSTSQSSLESFSLQNPNPSEKPSKKLTALETYAADHNSPPVTRNDIAWVKENRYDTKRLDASNMSIDSSSSSEQNDPNSMHKESEVLAFLQENRMRISQPGSSPIERISQSKPSTTDNDQSPLSSPASSTCNKTFGSMMTRKWTDVINWLDRSFDDFSKTLEDHETTQSQKDYDAEYSFDSIKD